VFRGISNINMDAKGRIAVPTRYRELLVEQFQKQLIVTVDWDQRCLLMYPLAEWEPLQKTIMGLPSLDPKARRLQRLLVGHAQDVELDGSGRVLLPPALRSIVGLEKQVVLIGQGDKFEIWSEESWGRQREDYAEWADDDGQIHEAMKFLSL